MTLSKRMEMVAGLVPPGLNTVADIGCDHAYVSIALIERKIAAKVIAMDVRKGPLQIAARNIETAGLHNTIELRLSDGMDELLCGEADAIIIAGMGGLLMKGILERGADVLSSDDAHLPILILQPQSEFSEVRKYLHTIGYVITEEQMLVEDGKYYTAIKAVSGKGEETGRPYPNEERFMEEDVFLEYGYYNLFCRNPVLLQYLKREQAILKAIYEKLIKQRETLCLMGKEMPEQTRERIEEIEKELSRNEKGILWFEEKNL